MREIPETTRDAWVSARFTGDQRAVARVTVQHQKMKLHHHALMSTFRYKKASDIKDITIDNYIDTSRGQRINQTYANFLFANVGKPMEMLNVVSVQWNRSVDSDVADCTITAVNSRIVGAGGEIIDDQLDIPGYYSFGRGATAFSRSRWGQDMNPWFGMLVPDNIIRTYEGYGSDMTVAPEIDPHMIQTGTWIIDDVSIGADGTLSIKCRDVGRILLDQMYYPPLVPKAFYDESWQNWSGSFVGGSEEKRTKIKLSYDQSSNQFYQGQEIIAGHRPQHAFDGNPNSYWLSIGNARPSRAYSYEWIQCNVKNQSIDTVSIRTMKKGYAAFVSVMVGGQWQGESVISYNGSDGPALNGGDIKWVALKNIDDTESVDIPLGKTYKKVQKIRITLTNLQNFRFGTYHYRAAIREVRASVGLTVKSKLKKGPTGSNPGRYNDYTDIVKLICAWGGFYWPKAAYQRISNPPGLNVSQRVPPPGYDDTRDCRPLRGDEKVLGAGVKGRVWGDFMNAGTAGIVPLDNSNFDKKSLMDCINYIKEILGFLFYIDELGSIQWRLPNMTNKGNYVTVLAANPGYKKGKIHYVSDTGHILSLTSQISSSNVREIYFVGDTNGKIGSYAPGFNPNPTGLRRYAGWTDVGFAPETNKDGKSTKAQIAFAQQQADLMADMLSLRQLFTYRTNKTRIPANPAIQIDDQIRIAERVTSEGYIHYIQGISSSLDNTTGEWTYDLTTHWLGFDPASKWLFQPKQMKKVTREYLAAQRREQAKLRRLAAKYGS